MITSWRVKSNPWVFDFLNGNSQTTRATGGMGVGGEQQSTGENASGLQEEPSVFSLKRLAGRRNSILFLLFPFLTSGEAGCALLESRKSGSGY